MDRSWHHRQLKKLGGPNQGPQTEPQPLGPDHGQRRRCASVEPGCRPADARECSWGEQRPCGVSPRGGHGPMVQPHSQPVLQPISWAISAWRQIRSPPRRCGQQRDTGCGTESQSRGGMKRRHQRTLELIFSRPVSDSVPWRDIEALFQERGGEVSERAGSRVAVVLFGEARIFHRPHRLPDTGKVAVASIRKCFEEHEVTP